MLALLLQSLALGFSAGASPGPFQTYLITESAAYGWRAGLRIAFVPLVSDAPIIALMLFVLAQLPTAALGVIGLVGVGVLLLLAWGLWQRFQQPALPAPSTQRSFWRGVLLNLTNPNPYIFWGTVGGPLLVSSWQQGPLFALTLLGGFYGMFLSTSIALAGVGAALKRLPASAIRWLWLACALVMLLLAGSLAYSSVLRIVTPV